MNSCGIICEYDPLHTGHAYQISQVREQLCASVVCAMSGNFVQRAKSACMDKRVRADNAVKCGADVVLEIPFPFSSLSANGFAAAGVEILAKSRLCTHIAFGSECADTELLSETAQILMQPQFSQMIKNEQRQDPSQSYARARSTVLRDSYGEQYAKVLESPNDILAVEYIRANIALGSPLLLFAVKRSTPRGGKDSTFASSSYIREILKSGNVDEIKHFLPYDADVRNFDFDEVLLEKIMHANLCVKKPKDLVEVCEISHDGAYALVKSARTAQSYDELTKLLASKSYTDAKVRRMILFAFFSVPKKYFKELPAYTNVLAYSENGQKMLGETRKDREIVFSSNMPALRSNRIALEQFELAQKAESILQKFKN